MPKGVRVFKQKHKALTAFVTASPSLPAILAGLAQWLFCLTIGALENNMQADHEKHPRLPPRVIHALRSPLGALVSALDVAELAGVDAGVRDEAMAIARRQAQKLAALIDSLDRQ